jgi:hypothetical protein
MFTTVRELSSKVMTDLQILLLNQANFTQQDFVLFEISSINRSLIIYSLVCICYLCFTTDRSIWGKVCVISYLYYFHSSLNDSNKFWAPHSLLFKAYRVLFPRKQGVRNVNLTTHLQILPRSRIRVSTRPPPHTPWWRSGQLVKHRDSFTFASFNAWYKDAWNPL